MRVYKKSMSCEHRSFQVWQKLSRTDTNYSQTTQAIYSRQQTKRVYEAIASRIRRTLNAQRAAKKIRDATSWILWVNHGTRLTKHLKICTRMVTTLSHVENFSYCKRYCLNCTFKMLSCLLMCFMCTENDKFCSFLLFLNIALTEL